MKNIISIITVLTVASTKVMGQVGVNTATPKTIFDVSPKRNTAGVLTDNTQALGLQAPRVTLAELTTNTAAYGADQSGAFIYITDISGGAATGQRANMDAAGYYYFDGSMWQKVLAKNIYNANGALTNDRKVDLNNNSLDFTGNEQTVTINESGGLILSAQGNNTGYIRVATSDTNGNGSSSYFDTQLFADEYLQMTAFGEVKGILFGTQATLNPAPIEFSTSVGGGALGEVRMKIAAAGNVGINATTPTEKLDVNGNTRLRNLPLSGTANAIYTKSGGTVSATQNQTFIATKTIVADANGVLGYVNGIPTDPGVPKILVSASVPRTQNIKNTTGNVTGDFSIENMDVVNSWNSNVFTIPAGMGSVYVIAMQVSNKHTVESGSWYTVAYLQKSTDGGTTWNPILADTRSNMLGADIDNGNTLSWTGTLSAGDKIRVRFNCSATADNIVDLGSITITKLAQ